MPGSSSNNSFIPKRQPSKRKRSQPARRIFLITVIAYSLMFASLLAAGASVLYKNYTESQLENEVVQLDSAINTFSVQDFRRVQEFDTTLKQASDRIANTASIVAVLEEMDNVVVQPIQIQKLTLERTGDDQMIVEVNFVTETLDAALFQRKVLNTNSDVFTDVAINEVDLAGAASDEAVDDEPELAPGLIAFDAKFTMPMSAILYDPAEARRTDLGVFTSTPVPTGITDLAQPTTSEEPSDAVLESLQSGLGEQTATTSDNDLTL